MAFLSVLCFPETCIPQICDPRPTASPLVSLCLILANMGHNPTPRHHSSRSLRTSPLHITAQPLDAQPFVRALTSIPNFSLVLISFHFGQLGIFTLLPFIYHQCLLYPPILLPVIKLSFYIFFLSGLPSLSVLFLISCHSILFSFPILFRPSHSPHSRSMLSRTDQCETQCTDLYRRC